VISAVELEPAESQENKNESQTSVASAPQNEFDRINRSITSAATQQTAKAPRGKTSGETVALRLEMAAYFRRANYQPIPVESAP
jgi:hypothetical protein